MCFDEEDFVCKIIAMILGFSSMTEEEEEEEEGTRSKRRKIRLSSWPNGKRRRGTREKYN
tara:strand:+ start:800 stop:979 length:180 start_codon:yes stop_codon:yes gene_type:complete